MEVLQVNIKYPVTFKDWISFWVHLLDMHPEWNSILIFTFLNKEMRYI